MKLAALFAMILAGAATPALLAQNCAPFQTVGTQCATTLFLGWGTAGLGTDSLVTFYVPPTVSAPVTFKLTQLSSSLGSAYTGYFATFGAFLGNTPQAITVANSTPLVGGPGQGGILHISQVCFDPTCTTTPPTGAVPNMFSAQIQVLAASVADLSKVGPPLLTIRFLDSNGIVSDEEQETAVSTPASTIFVIDSVAEAATPANRYVYSGSIVTLPYTVFSVTNPSATQSITGTVNLYDIEGNLVSAATIPAIPPSGAVGYLLVGRSPGDPLGLFPSTSMLPLADSQGIFHGAVEAVFNAPAIFLAQEFNGNAMLNLVVFVF